VSQISRTRGTAGINALPKSRRQAIFPMSFTARFAHVPRKMPKAVQICHVMTNPPRMLAGDTSAEKTGTVTSFKPILKALSAVVPPILNETYPMPSKIRQATSWPQCWVQADPIGASNEKMAPKKIVPRRPSQWFRGSDIHPALRNFS
jgi:hypothetical protein